MNGGTPVVYEYTYDPAGRLKTVTVNGGTPTVYDHDDNSNRLHNGAVYDDKDRLDFVGPKENPDVDYEYTENGELLSRTRNTGTTLYNYDALGNLISVTLESGSVVEYIYDGKNRRIGKKVDTILERAWLYKDGFNPVAELDGAGNLVSRFVYANRQNVPIYLEKGGNTYRVIADHLGSVRLVIDVNVGNIVQQIDYDQWGNVDSDTNSKFQPFGFAGGLYDPDTKLVNFGHRDYDGETGRWTAKDPIRFDGRDTNLYGYVLQDPINFIDPFGLYGTNSCKFYDDLCRRIGGYYCQTAKLACEVSKFNQFGTGEEFSNYSQCVRQCLQERAENKVTCTANPSIDIQTAFDDHVICFIGCGNNPENPYNPKGPDLPDRDPRLPN